MAFLIGGANTLDTGYDIENSLRFNDGDSTQLNRAFTADNASRKKFTISFWVKRGELGSDNAVFAARTTANFWSRLHFDSSDRIRLQNVASGSTDLEFEASPNLRDPSAWYHIVFAIDTSQGAIADGVKLYINGTRITSTSSSSYTQNATFEFNRNGTTTYIGHDNENSSYFDGYISEFFYVDNQQLAPTAFGKTDDNGVWIPIDAKDDLTFGTNGVYMEFKNINPILGDAAGRHKVTPTNGATFNTSIKKFNSSSLYLDNTNNYLNVTNNLGDFGFGACNSNSWTVEFWVYYLGNSSSGSDFIVHGDNNSFKINWRPGDPQFKVEVQDTEYAFGNNSPGLTDDTWTHIAIVNEGGTLKIYKDGTVDGTTHDISGKTIATPNNFFIGYSDADTFDGHIDELRVSNSARYTGNFSVATSVFDVDSNTKLLLHMDTDPSIGTDSSGEGNHFTSVNFTVDDQCTDTPTNNFATLNPLHQHNSVGVGNVTRGTLSEGNTHFDNGGSVSGSERYYRVYSTIAIPSSGKWYWEVKPTKGTSGLGFRWVMGLSELNAAWANTSFVEWTDGSYSLKGDGHIWYNNNDHADYTDLAVNDIISFKYDADNRDLYFAINGTYENSGNAVLTSTQITTTTEKLIILQIGSEGDVETSVNFGNAPFSISSGNSDGAGYGNFEYAVPSGYYALCTKNLGKYG